MLLPSVGMRSVGGLDQDAPDRAGYERLRCRDLAAWAFRRRPAGARNPDEASDAKTHRLNSPMPTDPQKAKEDSLIRDRASVQTPIPVREQDWSERIARARKAREEGKKAREGRPATFRTFRALNIA